MTYEYNQVPNRIIVLIGRRVRDFLTCVPALRSLRLTYPSTRITLIGPLNLRQLVNYAEVADDLISPTGVYMGRHFHQEKPDWIIDFRHNMDHSAHPTMVGGRHIAENPAAAKRFIHYRDRWCQLLGSINIACNPQDLWLSLPDRAPDIPLATVICPGRLELEHSAADFYPEIITWLRAHGHTVVLVGPAIEYEQSRNLAEKAELSPDQVLTGRLEPHELASLVASARLVISNNSDTAHLSYAYHTSSITLCHEQTAALWGPPPSACHQVIDTSRSSGFKPQTVINFISTHPTVIPPYSFDNLTPKAAVKPESSTY